MEKEKEKEGRDLLWKGSIWTQHAPTKQQEVQIQKQEQKLYQHNEQLHIQQLEENQQQEKHQRDEHKQIIKQQEQKQQHHEYKNSNIMNRSGIKQLHRTAKTILIWSNRMIYKSTQISKWNFIPEKEKENNSTSTREIDEESFKR